ncbi:MULTISPECIES: 30S ribosome-binding factor RbfA [Cyanophyceae]|uniref:30S ribosome-binding factor RbfA n=1 Tax=Cyanophyceae TaxID=3028117 RepID=UPI0016842153|nr:MULTISPECIES: 30S ribosome-binding factor RbfA [Cyanophyceae]MBD1917619.1 30S ribosome-binding factor RbfA [Phormidium sp. FACHB-77]MBD2029505.1 30S ribosome-binding factor RbfA [Phormidium sp. FACHB-322]MBD2050766.1 30S ribosome-binding factor RbfA [Leptolyngbya sp. FACHB-60]
MPNNRRVERVASLIKREISQMVMLDIKDDRVGAGMVSVTDVDVSGDLQHAKVFVSIYGTPEAKAETMEGLHAATGFVRSELGQRLRLRRTPEIIFKEDVGMERGTNVLNLINQLSQERAAKGLTDEFFEDDAATPEAASPDEPIPGDEEE